MRRERKLGPEHRLGLVMATATLVQLVSLLANSTLLDEDQVGELSTLADQFPEPESLAKELISREWLTGYQITQIARNKSTELNVGQYLILDKLGEGGMGVVYKAKQRNLDRMVAIKVIKKDCLANPKAIQRFLREMRVAGQLAHPNIVRAYDADQVGNTHFIVMEYIDGIDLLKLVKKAGPLPVMQACDYIRQAALGLQHAHERGMVHRDIKPANLLVTPNPLGDKSKHRTSSGAIARPGMPNLTPWGQMKILDVGLARLSDPETGDSGTHLTQLNAVMGTPEFIAPEQARNSRACDIRSDIYSLGCTLYYLLSGRPPFHEGTLTEKLLKHQLDPPEPIVNARQKRLLEIRPNCPPSQFVIPTALTELLARMLAKDPNDRPATPIKLANDLQDILDADPRTALSDTPSPQLERTPPPMALLASDSSNTPQPLLVAQPVRRSRGRWWLYAVVSLFLIGGLISLRRPLKESSPEQLLPKSSPVRDQAAASKWRSILDRAQAIGPVKGNLEELRKHDFFADLRFDIAFLQSQYPTSAEAAQAPGLLARMPSPLDFVDRKSLADKFAWLPHELVTIIPLKGKLALNKTSFETAGFSPDARFLIAGGDEGTMRLWDVAGYTFPYNLPSPIKAHDSKVLRVAFAPFDARFVSAGQDGFAKIWDPIKRTEIQSFDHKKQPVASARFFPDGKTLITASHDGKIRLWDAGKGTEWKALEGRAGKLIDAQHEPAGPRIFWIGERPVLRWQDPDGENAEEFPLDAAPQSFAFSPDGHTLAVGLANGLIQVLRWDGKHVEDLSRCKGHTEAVTCVSFSVDGKRVFSTSHDQAFRIWETQSGAHQRHIPLRSSLNGLAYSPDTRHVALAQNNGTLMLLRLAE